MALTLVTGPTVEPVTVTEAKSQLRLDIADDDTYIGTLITAAREWVEGQTKRALVAQTWDWAIDYGFPWRQGYRIDLPLNPVISVASIAYVDDAGNAATWAADQYTAVCRQNGSFIVPAYNVSLPVIRNVPNAITVRFTAGFYDNTASPETGSVPQPLKQAIILLVAHWYENREAAGKAMAEAPYAVEALISPYRDCRA
jgi:uncharacterized phiE125 gp8 family phage protein